MSKAVVLITLEYHLDFDPMTLMVDLDLDVLELFLDQGFQQLKESKQDRQTDRQM